MAESVVKGSVGLLVMGIKCITALIQEYNLQNESVLSLHREILLLRPCIENLKTSSIHSGIHNRLQRLIVLIEEIRIWLEAFAAKSSLGHFFFALIHKKEINNFYIRIQEIKMEMGFEIKVDSYQHQSTLYTQINVLLEKLNSNQDIDKIKELLDIHKQMYEIKFENHITIIKNVDMKYSRLISEYEIELDDMRNQTNDMQIRITQMDDRIKEILEKIRIFEHGNSRCTLHCPTPKSSERLLLTDTRTRGIKFLQKSREQRPPHRKDPASESTMLAHSSDSYFYNFSEYMYKMTRENCCDSPQHTAKWVYNETSEVSEPSEHSDTSDHSEPSFLSRLQNSRRSSPRRGASKKRDTDSRRKNEGAAIKLQPNFVELGLDPKSAGQRPGLRTGMYTDSSTQTRVSTCSTGVQTDKNGWLGNSRRRGFFTQDDLFINTHRPILSDILSLDAYTQTPLQKKNRASLLAPPQCQPACVQTDGDGSLADVQASHPLRNTRVKNTYPHPVVEQNTFHIYNYVENN
jgi:hypothetical protein